MIHPAIHAGELLYLRHDLRRAHLKPSVPLIQATGSKPPAPVGAPSWPGTPRACTRHAEAPQEEAWAVLGMRSWIRLRVRVGAW